MGVLCAHPTDRPLTRTHYWIALVVSAFDLFRKDYTDCAVDAGCGGQCVRRILIAIMNLICSVFNIHTHTHKIHVQANNSVRIMHRTAQHASGHAGLYHLTPPIPSPPIFPPPLPGKTSTYSPKTAAPSCRAATGNKLQQKAGRLTVAAAATATAPSSSPFRLVLVWSGWCKIMVHPAAAAASAQSLFCARACVCVCARVYADNFSAINIENPLFLRYLYGMWLRLFR